MTRSGGTSPIRNVMPIASSRKVKTCRRRSRVRARFRSVCPMNRMPLRGVTIQRPSLPYVSACANSSILRSMSPTLTPGDRLPRRSRGEQERHPHDAQASEEQPIHAQPPVRSGTMHATTSRLGRDASTTYGVNQSHPCDSKNFFTSRLRTPRVHSRCMPVAGGDPVDYGVVSVGEVVAALAARLRQQPQPVDARRAVERLRGVVQRRARRRRRP